jgi:hypothetical protein
MTTNHKIKTAAWYVSAYTIELLAVLMHEVSHFIFALIPFYFSIISFPKIVFSRMFSIKIISEEEGNHQSQTQSFGAAVNFSADDLNKGVIAFIASAPAFMTIALFLYLPFWVYPLLVAQLQNLWLSASDVQQIMDWFATFKKQEQVNMSVANNKTKEL